MEKKKIIIGQSGGPSAAINATLSGIIAKAISSEEVSTVYGMKNGIEGLLRGDVIELNGCFSSSEEIDILKLTPASALGSCRKKLPDAMSGDKIFADIISLLRKLKVSCFFYIGGNDSMDTVHKLSVYAKNNNISDISFIGVPKTIDNDLTVTDHTPGYGSAAKYICSSVAEIVRDCAVYTVPAVTIVEIMGRDAGWLAASAGLAEGVDYIYLPEVEFDNDRFFRDIDRALKCHPNVVIAVSEGIKYSNGEYVGTSGQSGVKDVFGHKYLSGTGKTLEHLLKEHFGCKVRSVEINILQRCAGHLLSETDINESFETGAFSLALALSGESGVMPTVTRKSGEYSVVFGSCDVSLVANKIKYVPLEYINESGNGITDECKKYIKPLIMGEIYPKYENGMPKHFVFR